MTSYLIHTTIAKVEEKERTVSVAKDGTPTIENLGWFILLADSCEWRHIGMDKPDLVKGQEVTVRIEPR